MDASEARIYVQRSKINLGMGETSRTITAESHYQVEELADGRFRAVLLDMNGQPTGLVEYVTAEELAGSYQYLPDYHKTVKSPQERAVEKQLAVGKTHLERREFNSAEFEFDQILKVNDRHLEAHLGKGEALIGQGDMEGARQVLEKVGQIDELYSKENKHVLNAYGITLRRTGFFDQAIAAYRKALKIDPKDENIYYNLARACLGLKQLPLGLKFLRTVLEMNPGHAEARKLVDRITGGQVELDLPEEN